MNAAQVRAKARMAMKRREEEIETEEMEGGELNLVPYLDIVTNVMLFLLATVTAGLILGNINIGLPEASGEGPAGASPSGEQQDDDQPPLDMVVVVTKEKIRFFSTSGEEGSIDSPLLTIPAEQPGAKYDYGKLTEAASKLVERRGWKEKLRLSEGPNKEPACIDRRKDPPALLPMDRCRPKAATEVLLAAGAEIPYYVVIATMDALRAAPDGTLLFPDVIFVTDLDTSYAD